MRAAGRLLFWLSSPSRASRRPHGVLARQRGGRRRTSGVAAESLARSSVYTWTACGVGLLLLQGMWARSCDAANVAKPAFRSPAPRRRPSTIQTLWWGACSRGRISTSPQSTRTGMDADTPWRPRGRVWSGVHHDGHGPPFDWVIGALTREHLHGSKRNENDNDKPRPYRGRGKQENGKGGGKGAGKATEKQ